MASLLAEARAESSMQTFTRTVHERTPHVDFCSFYDNSTLDSGHALHSICTKCGGRDRLSLEMNDLRGREIMDKIINFVLDFESNHEHPPVAKSPSVRTESKIRPDPAGRKFRV